MCVCVWCVSDDWVYLGVEEERQEYVMKEQSIIYRGLDNYIDSLTWNLGQVRTHTRRNTHMHAHKHEYKHTYNHKHIDWWSLFRSSP